MSTKGAHSGMSGMCGSKRPMSARPMKMASIQHVSMAAKRKGRSISPRLGVCANSVVRIDKRCCLRLVAAFARGIFWLSALSSGCFGGKFIPGSDLCSHLITQEAMELGKAPTVKASLSFTMAHPGSLSNVGQIFKNQGTAKASILYDALRKHVVVISALPKGNSRLRERNNHMQR